MNQSARIAVYTLVCLVALAAWEAPSPASGQSGDTTPVFIALPETFVDLDARVVLLREPGRNVVVLNPAEADVESLSVGLMLLTRLVRETPTPRSGQMIPVTGFAFTRDLTEGWRELLESTLADLRQRPLSNVGNLGPGRWLRYVAR